MKRVLFIVIAIICLPLCIYSKSNVEYIEYGKKASYSNDTCEYVFDYYYNLDTVLVNRGKEYRVEVKQDILKNEFITYRGMIVHDGIAHIKISEKDKLIFERSITKKDFKKYQNYFRRNKATMRTFLDGISDLGISICFAIMEPDSDVGCSFNYTVQYSGKVSIQIIPEGEYE